MRGEQLIAAIRWHDPDEDWKFAPHERTTVPGAPANPDHPLGLRYAYGVIAVLVGITAGLGNALVSVNLLQLQGALGGYVDEIAWLPAAYVMTNISMNLLLIKFRQQFGLRLFTGGFVALYAVVTLGHIFVRTFATAIAVRAASGMVAAALTSLTLFYTVQALPARWRLRATVIGISIPQIGTPLARLFSTELLALGEWRTLYIFEFGLALMTLAAVFVLRLPHGERQQAFEPLDFASFGLFAGGMALFSAVIGEGRYLWWTDTPWLGWALSGSIVLVAAAILLDYYRRRPLIATRWLTSADMMRFVVVGILMRLALSEQSYAAVGLLNTLGFNNDQFHPSGDCSMPNCRSFKSARRDSAPMSICTVQWAGLGSSSERKRASRLADSTSGACTHSSHKPPLAMPIARSKSGKSSFACSITATKDGDN